MPYDGDTQILQVFRRPMWQDFAVDFVIAKCGLVLSKTKAPQPSPNVHCNVRLVPGYDPPDQVTCPAKRANQQIRFRSLSKIEKTRASAYNANSPIGLRERSKACRVLRRAGVVQPA
jgi:hypothetical protein